MDATPPDAAAGLARLRQRFIEGLPARWAEIVDAGTAEAREAALHRLAGAAGTYGLHAVSAAARHAEQALHAHAHAPQPAPGASGPGPGAQPPLAALRAALADAGVTVR